MNLHRIDLLWHCWMVQSCLAQLGGEAALDLGSFLLEVRALNRYYRLYPRFLFRSGDQVVFADRLSRNIDGFAGWLPYVNKRWPIGSGKFAFKQFCLDRQLPTPRFWRHAAPEMRAFLIKHDESSCGHGMRGPFPHYDQGDARQSLQAQEYYEEFVPGRTIKAWYWEERLVSVESRPMPMIAGDGTSTVRELLERAKRPGMKLNWERFNDIAQYQGLQLETVLPKAEARLADFRFGSPLVQAVPDTMATLERHKDFPFVEELVRIGRIFWRGIPEDVRPATLYTVDGIVGSDGRLSLLEMNCNPAVHTEVYPFMLERLFGARSADAAPAPIPAGALPLQSVLANKPRWARSLSAGQPLVGSLTRWLS